MVYKPPKFINAKLEKPKARYVCVNDTPPPLPPPSSLLLLASSGHSPSFPAPARYPSKKIKKESLQKFYQDKSLPLVAEKTYSSAGRCG